MEGVVEANNRFTVDLHQALRNDENFTNRNLFYSPSSLSVSLAMTYMGARGDTAEQLSEALHWEAMSNDQLHHEQRHFLNALKESNAEGNELLAANRLFVQKSFTIEQGFLEGTKKFYNAEMALVDYQKDPEGARTEVNDWVEEKTKQKIKNLIPERVFDSRTRLTLVNAIYFKGLWRNQFKESATDPQDFFVSEREKIKVQMMHLKSNFKHVGYEGELGCQLLELPYEGEDLSMLILLPQEKYGLTDVEANLTYDKLQRAIALTQSRDETGVDLHLPRFKMTQQFQLNEILAELGATDMFNEFKADLSGISTLISPNLERLYVSLVIHKAFVEVNEKGTEAAAATAVVVKTRSLAPRPSKFPVFCVDHPFIFLIFHQESGGILFMGRMARPE